MLDDEKCKYFKKSDLEFGKYKVMFVGVKELYVSFSEGFVFWNTPVSIEGKIYNNSDVIMPKFVAKQLSNRKDIVFSSIGEKIEDYSSRGAEKIKDSIEDNQIQENSATAKLVENIT